jgi:hypothetical protein
MLKIFHHDIPKEYGLLDFVINSISYANSPLEDSDLVLHNKVLWGLEKHDLKRALAGIANHYPPEKKTLVFVVADYEDKLPVPKSLILLRTSIRKSIRAHNELPLPYVWSSYEQNSEACISEAKPCVGFCGLASKPRRKLIKTFLASPDIICNFICRDKFWGGSPHDKMLTQEFDNNMAGNSFILAPRGKGNFSMRFYQALSAGRIPVLVDTDNLLPFSENISWKDKIIFESNEKRCAERVLEVFRSGAYLSMQRECRQVYEQYFSFENYFKELSEVLKKEYL